MSVHEHNVQWKIKSPRFIIMMTVTTPPSTFPGPVSKLVHDNFPTSTVTIFIWLCLKLATTKELCCTAHLYFQLENRRTCWGKSGHCSIIIQSSKMSTLKLYLYHLGTSRPPLCGPNLKLKLPIVHWAPLFSVMHCHQLLPTLLLLTCHSPATLQLGGLAGLALEPSSKFK